MPKLDNQTIQFSLVVAVAAAMVIQTIVLLAALIVLRKLAKSIRGQIADVHDSVMPVIDDTRELIARVKPRIEETALDLALLARSLRDQTADIQMVADEIIARARSQAGSSTACSISPRDPSRRWNPAWISPRSRFRSAMACWRAWTSAAYSARWRISRPAKP